MNFRVLHTEWSSGWGGQEQRIILESRKLIALGHEVLIAAQPGSGILEKAAEFSVPSEEVLIKGSFDLRAISRIASLIRKYGITVVNTHSGKDSWVGSFAAKLEGVKLLVRTRHLSIPISNNPLNFVHRMPDGIVTTGEAIRQEMIEENHICSEKIISIPTGVALERFDPGIDGSGIREEFGIGRKVPIISMVAVLRGMKRHDLLIAAAKRLKATFPEAMYLVVGEGPKRARIEAGIREAGMEGSFILTGYRENIPQIFAASDLVVLTSDKFEGIPQTLSQAMAMAKPVVAAPVGGIPELIVDGRTGLMAETGNADSFAQAMGRLLSDVVLRTELGEAARRHILEGYTDDVMAEKTLDFYRVLFDRKFRKKRTKVS